MNRDLVRELATLMQDALLGTVGTDIFIGELPESIVEGFMLVNSPSPNPEKYIDHEYIVVDFWYRSPHTDAAYSKLRDAYNFFHRKYHYQTSNWHIFFSEAIGNINDVDRDREGGKLYRLSVQFICRNLNNVS